MKVSNIKRGIFMSVTLVLNGGIKSCCSVTPTEVVKNSVRAWLPEEVDLKVIDITTEPYELSGLAATAEKYFKEKVYPLVFVKDQLAMIGGVPNKKELLGMVKGDIEFGITENDIIQAAKSLGYAE